MTNRRRNEQIRLRERWANFLARRLFANTTAEFRTGGRIGYYLSRFPVLSETFVRREIEGLRKLGLDIHVVANLPGSGNLSTEDLEVHIESTQYLFPLSAAVGIRALIGWLFRRPLRTSLLAMYVHSVDYGEEKTLLFDIQLLGLSAVLASWMRYLAVDQIHCPWSHSIATAALGAGRLLEVPVTLQARAFELHRDSCAKSTIERLRRAHGVVTNSQFNLDFIETRLGESMIGKVQWVYNSIPLSKLMPVNRKDMHQGIRILSVGRLVPKKGFDTLLSSITRLPASLTVECRIVGGSDSRSSEWKKYLEQTAHELGIEERVSFLGPLSFAEVVQQYQWADVLVLASSIPEDGDIDVTPNVILETMAMGLPIVSTPVGAIPELFEDGISGLLVPVGDSVQLAECLAELAQDSERANRMGHEARSRAVTLFNPDENLKKLANFLRGA